MRFRWKRINKNTYGFSPSSVWLTNSFSSLIKFFKAYFLFQQFVCISLKCRFFNKKKKHKWIFLRYKWNKIIILCKQTLNDHFSRYKYHKISKRFPLHFVFFFLFYTPYSFEQSNTYSFALNFNIFSFFSIFTSSCVCTCGGCI